MSESSYFSVSYDLVLLGGLLPYNLYINSSNSEKEKFVRIFPSGEMMLDEDLDRLRKYKTIYISESQRGIYLKSLAKSSKITDVQKTEMMRNSAFKHLDKIFDKGKEFTTEVLNETVAGCRDSVEAMVDTIQDYDVEKVSELIGSLSFHDFYTFDHSVNVSMYCISILKAYKPKATKKEMVTAGLGGMLHDLGKMKISTEIINNPGKLTDEQFSEIQNHPGYGKELFCNHMYDSDEIDMEVISRVIFEHHENVNGTGYPNKIKSEDIHLYAKITAIADFFDALTTKRSYHEVMSVQDAVNVMSRTKGKKLDPALFDIFVKSVHHFVQSKNVKVELPETFDPCQPQNVLPFQKVQYEKEKTDFGEIKVLDNAFGKKSNKKNKVS
jgi:HD-GYP domain-containing protein (c-di-GMP phosphodiesterase class II)